MDVPDKLHCMHRLSGDYSCSTTPFGGSVEYIRKGEILEWADNWKKLGMPEEFLYAMETLISHINSL